MRNEPRYSGELTFSEFRIAACDEIDLEEIVWKERDTVNGRFRRYHEADRAALREIDRLKIAGIYEAERARLAAYLPPPSSAFERLIQRFKDGEFEPMENFLRGLRSPDREQRERFERLYGEAELANKNPNEFWHILQCLEKANKPKGRWGVSPPWRNVAAALDVMRLAIAGGASIQEAAQEQAHREGVAQAENRARYLGKLYRQKMRLRGIK